MEKTAVQRLAKVLRFLVSAVLVLNLICLLLVPGFAALLAEGELGAVLDYLKDETAAYPAHTLGHMLMFFLNCLWAVWAQGDAALLTVFFWLCGTCTALILRQADQVLDTVLAGNPFQLSNAKALKRAAVCCWVISGTALVRLLLWLWREGNAAPLFTYNTLFIPAFLMAGLLFLVMSALFQQAAELKEDQDLTI